ncbi:hypothetical protein CONPUDRAFT_168675 [Coniophora puteana RWD-64-598 SS2]|uniref:Zn(2)-C6 fungal-type domain-containing protein n=1 Tax=Coniophora puteana (strain RWD-64-598) TaxID=741705 RepID=A0A5M3MCN1_CONPW|nr:uncharacterized protein CONPUDRAFT_168675 [Coniophora puteana RWD-64-598 SS2]EIW76968.1 hypothetical protein CONPUDRAFT_168675 [Coniophora puteana RWD-64-598 SS2]
MPKEKPNAARLPPCDACKLRRVRCDPVLPPASCPRCVSKNIICTTNVIPRGRRKASTGRRIEQARVLFGDARPSSTSSPAGKAPPVAGGSVSPVVRAESRMFDLEVSGELIAHLLQLYAHVPRARVIPCNFIISAFESSGRRIASLSPSTQTLMLAMSAISSHVSSHPVLFGAGPRPPALSTFLVRSLSLSSKALYEFGKRRAAACRALTEMALEHAWRAKVLSSGDDEAMAACFLLQVLESRSRPRPAVHVWKAAFIAQLRQRLLRCREVGFGDFLSSESSTFFFFTSTPSMMAWPPRNQPTHPDPESFEHQAQPDGRNYLQPQSLCDAGQPLDGNIKLQEMRLRWSMQLMWEALTCVWQGEVCGYSLHDEALLCGPPPPSLAELVVQVRSESVLWWDTRGFIDLVRPYAYHVTRLALSSYDWQMRRRSGLPFSFTRFAEHMDDLKHLHFLLSVAQVRCAMAYSYEATEFRRAESMAESADGEPSIPSIMGMYMLHSMRTALASVNIPVLEDLQARVKEASAVPGPADPDMSKLELLLHTFRRAVVHWGHYIIRNTLNATYLAWLTHLADEPFVFWCDLIVDTSPIEDGGDAITRSEKLACLEIMSEVFGVVSWSRPGAFEHPLRSEIGRAIEEIKLAQALNESFGWGVPVPDSRSVLSYEGDYTESSCWLGAVPAVLELPDIEAAMRDAGVMDMIKGYGPSEASLKCAGYAAMDTSFASSSQETFGHGQFSGTSVAAIDYGSTIGWTHGSGYGHEDARHATSSFATGSTGVQTQAFTADAPLNFGYVPCQGYVHGAGIPGWDTMGVHMGMSTGQTGVWTVDNGEFDGSTDESFRVLVDQTHYGSL